jgi:putative transposase
LAQRGEDILIVAKDRLSSFSEAIAAEFPRTEQQLCIIHQLRNATKYVSKKDIKAVMADLKSVYRAATLEQAEVAFDQVKEN